MRLTVLHDTLYDYSPAVETAHHIACLRPRETAGQKLLSHALVIDPTPPRLSTRTDAFGNQPTYWDLAQTHERLHVRACSEVITSPPPELLGTQAWEAVCAHFRYHASQAADPQTCFVFGSRHAPLNDAFAAYAQSAFTPGRPLQAAATALMQKIHQDFTYASESTDIHTPALEALQTRQGVCQDFAHILIACLRSLGLAARYVSGYLLTQPPEGQERLVGADASHAWASVYLPELASSACGGWLDLDPTNNRQGFGAPGEDYVVVAWGRDFADVSPLRGVLRGGQSHTLKVGVSVTPAALPCQHTTEHELDRPTEP